MRGRGSRFGGRVVAQWIPLAAALLIVGSGCAEEESCQWEVTVHAEFWAQDCWGWSVVCDGSVVTCRTVEEQDMDGCPSQCDHDGITCEGPAIENYVFRFQAPPGAKCAAKVGRGSAPLEEACGVQEVTVVATGSPEEGPQPQIDACSEQ